MKTEIILALLTLTLAQTYNPSMNPAQMFRDMYYNGIMDIDEARMQLSNNLFTAAEHVQGLREVLDNNFASVQDLNQDIWRQMQNCATERNDRIEEIFENVKPGHVGDMPSYDYLFQYGGASRDMVSWKFEEMYNELQELTNMIDMMSSKLVQEYYGIMGDLSCNGMEKSYYDDRMQQAYEYCDQYRMPFDEMLNNYDTASTVASVASPPAPAASLYWEQTTGTWIENPAPGLITTPTPAPFAGAVWDPVTATWMDSTTGTWTATDPGTPPFTGAVWDNNSGTWMTPEALAAVTAPV